MCTCAFETRSHSAVQAVFEFTVMPLPELPECWVTGEGHPAQHGKFLKMSDCVSSPVLPFYLSGVLPTVQGKGPNRAIHTVLLLILW